MNDGQGPVSTAGGGAPVVGEWPVGQLAEITTWTDADCVAQTDDWCVLKAGGWWSLGGTEVWPPNWVTAVRPLRLVPDDAIVLPAARLTELERHAAQARVDAGLNAAARDDLQRRIDWAIEDAQSVVPDERREWLAHWLGQRLAAGPDQSPVPVPRDGQERTDPGHAYVGTCDAGDCNELTVAVVDDDGWLSVCGKHLAKFAGAPLTLAQVFRALADVHAKAGSKSPVRMFTDAAEAAEKAATTRAGLADDIVQAVEFGVPDAAVAMLSGHHGGCTCQKCDRIRRIFVARHGEDAWSPHCDADIPPMELPGMWHPSDFSGGATDAAEAVSGGSGDAERQEPATVADPSAKFRQVRVALNDMRMPITDAGYRECLNEIAAAAPALLAEVGRLTAEVARLGDDRDEAAAQLQRAEVRLALTKRHAEQARVDAGLTAAQRDGALLRVARYRAAIEGVHTLLLLAQSEGIDSRGCSPVKVKELADVLAAALGDGE